MNYRALIQKLTIIPALTLLILSNAAAKNYYVSDANLAPNSQRLGTKDNPWTTIADVTAFLNAWSNGPQGGDSILFQRGAQWDGRYLISFTTVKQRGITNSGNPLVLSDYGSQSQPKPQFNGNGTDEYALMLQNGECVVFENFSVTNKGADYLPGRIGIELRANSQGDVHGAVIRNCEIFDVNGHWNKLKGKGGGAAILIKATGGGRFVDAVIEYNYIHDVSRSGIWGNYNAGDPGTPEANLHQNFMIRHNLIERIPGDAIVAWGMQNSVVEYNIARDFIPMEQSIKGNAAAGIWAFHCNNVTIQHNQVSGHLANHDGQGYDADFNCINTIIQHNYSYNNCGGMALLCCNGSENFNINPIVRYNLSINDGYQRTDPAGDYYNDVPTFVISGPVEGAQIYNNTIYTKKKEAAVEKFFLKLGNWGGPWPVNTSFKNNTFYGEQHMGFHIGGSTSYTFDNNVYYNTQNAYEENAIYYTGTERWWDILLTDAVEEQGVTMPSNTNNDQGDFFENQIISTQIGAFAGLSNRPISIAQPLVNDSVVVSFQAFGNATVRIENLLREVMYQSSHADLSGEQTYDIGEYAQGVYFIYVKSGDTEVRHKFIKINEISTDANTSLGSYLYSREKLVNIYPNPITQGYFVIDFYATNGDAKVEIYSMVGSLVKIVEINSTTNAKVNVADLNTGMYIVKIQLGKKAEVQTIVVK